MRTAGIAVIAVVRVAAGLLTGAAAEAVPVPEGYRMSDYRAPTPPVVPGATTLTTAELQRLIAADEPVLVDVFPAPPRPADRPAGSVWLPPPRASLPGAVWLANVGFGALSGELDAYFRGNLRRLTGGRTDRPLVFFCEPDCWMSWNATRRALEYGYTRVFYYPEGAAGWAEAGLPLVPLRPVPVEEHP